ncbi:hypothetical protein DPMN_055565 [Dreissena polymorpha]|uniref:Uncharacterized protein n=3 Tax=Dreissena polymorpha TaxID=45954 RepID=A0A9D4CSL9_DREPO|nr:hypothetical protein DPMN_055565 [Dreissena polymorpha]
MSNQSQSSGSSSPSPRQQWGSRHGSRSATPDQGEGGRVPNYDRPMSSLSQLSNMTWTTEKSHQVTYLQ